MASLDRFHLAVAACAGRCWAGRLGRGRRTAAEPPPTAGLGILVVRDLLASAAELIPAAPPGARPPRALAVHPTRTGLHGARLSRRRPAWWGREERQGKGGRSLGATRISRPQGPPGAGVGEVRQEGRRPPGAARQNERSGGTGRGSTVQTALPAVPRLPRCPATPRPSASPRTSRARGTRRAASVRRRPPWRLPRRTGAPL